MKDFLKLVGTLTVICILSGVLLSVVNSMTRARIEAVKRQQRADAMKEVLPEFDNNPAEDTFAATNGSDVVTFYIARLGTKVVGAAFESVSKDGYGGDIRLMTGIDVPEYRLQGIDIIEHKETPGLGANIDADIFKSQFVFPLATAILKVKKDGGHVDAVTAATISSRAVVKAVDEGVLVYKGFKPQIESLK